MSISISVIILTHNEEIHLARALKSVSSFASSVYVIDSGSTDATIEIAKKHGAKTISRKWKHYADQMQWAIDNIDKVSGSIFNLMLRLSPSCCIQKLKVYTKNYLNLFRTYF